MDAGGELFLRNRKEEYIAGRIIHRLQNYISIWKPLKKSFISNCYPANDTPIIQPITKVIATAISPKITCLKAQTHPTIPRWKFQLNPNYALALSIIQI